MKIDKKFSVMIPTYNQRDDYLFSAIKSCLGQIYPPHQIIVSNDGGVSPLESIKLYLKTEPCVTGSSLDYVKLRVPIHSGKTVFLTVIDNPDNKGTAGALNNARPHIEGDYVAWLSSDDVFFPNFLLVQDKLLNHVDVGYCGFSEMVFDKETDEFLGSAEFQQPFCDKRNTVGMIDQKSFNKMLCDCIKRKSCFFNGCGFAYSKKVMDDIGLFNEELVFTQDFEFWLRMSRKYGVIATTEMLLSRREHNGRTHCSWDSEKYCEQKEKEFSILSKEFLSEG